MANAQPTATYDSAVFHTSIGAAMAAANGQPNGSEQTITASCSADPGCNDYFDIALGVGNTLFASLCAPGTSTFDTGLAVWRLTDLAQTGVLASNDDTCGVNAELSFVAPASGVYRLRIGGYEGAAGTYTLRYSAPTGSSIAPFVDDPLTVGVPVQAIHIQELRDRINALRVSTPPLAAFDFTDPVLTARSTVVQAVHLLELRTALNDVFALTTSPPPAYTPLAAGTTIRAVHIQEIRNAYLTAFQSAPCYILTRTHTGSGADPTASPANSAGCSTGQYHAGAVVQVTASPASGWQVQSWSGTNNDGSTATTNAVTMPGSARTVSVTYAATSLDSDGDRLSDAVETNTGVFVSSTNTGTNPDNPDTDGDGIKDGDEVLGTLAGLDLPGMGTSPVRKDILLEYDWFTDNLDACAAHSHRPSVAALARVTAMFEAKGIRAIHDYGQGGAFTGGNVIADANGVIDGGVSNAEFQAHKNSNFAANRHGYFHYVLNPHRYGTTSGSSGQAELPGDDLIVSLQCFLSDQNVANTIVHELGHNLLLRHGGNENDNYKPNYNSVMNYRYQFPGVDDGGCNVNGNGILDYSTGSRLTLNENSLNEFNGVCGAGSPVNWNGGDLSTSVAFNTRNYGSTNCGGSCGGLDASVGDFNDWGNLVYTGLTDADGALTVKEVISCMDVAAQPPPIPPVARLGPEPARTATTGVRSAVARGIGDARQPQGGDSTLASRTRQSHVASGSPPRLWRLAITAVRRIDVFLRSP
jgi:hypothetical protein